MTYRTPRGHFCERTEMLYHWLPKMMDWITLYREMALNTLLEGGMRYARNEAVEHLKRAAGFASGNMPHQYQITMADKFFEVEKVLTEAKRKIAEILKGA